MGQGINLVQPTGDGDNVLNFLGCEHRSPQTTVAGTVVKQMEWNAVSSLRRCLAKYEEAIRSVTGMYPRMSRADTPLVHEETRSFPHRRPASNEAYYECPTCLDTFPESYMQKYYHFEAHEQRKLKQIWPPILKPCSASPAIGGRGFASAVNHAGDPTTVVEDDYDDVTEWLAGVSGIELRHLDETVNADIMVASSSTLLSPHTAYGWIA